MLCQKTFYPDESCHKWQKQPLYTQTTSKTLFCYCSLVVEIFQQFRQTESCVRNFFVPMKYVIKGKSNKDIPQTTRRTLFYHCS